MTPISPVTYSPSSPFPTESGVQPLAQLAMQAAQLSGAEPAAVTDPGLAIWQELFLQELTGLPPLNSSNPNDIKAYAKQIEALFSTFTGITLEQKIALLQAGLVTVTEQNGQYDSLMYLLLGTMNLQQEMQKWMSNIIMSGGENEESTEW